MESRVEISLQPEKKQFYLNGSLKKERQIEVLKEGRAISIRGTVILKNISEGHFIVSQERDEMEYHILLKSGQTWLSSGNIRVWK